MGLIRLLLLLLAGLFLRSWFRSIRRSPQPERADPEAAPGPRSHPGFSGLSDQDISDADFEEIP